MHMRRTLVLAAVILAVAPLAAACGSAQADSTDSGFIAGDGSLIVVPPASRVQAPDVVGTTLDGTDFRLSDHRGDVVVLNVWASWCAPCRAEAPVLRAAAEDLGARGVTFVGLDTRDSDVSARSFVEKQGITYPNIVDPDGQIQLLFADSLPPQAIPSTLVIDREGRVAARALGRVSESSIRGMVEPLLTEPPQPAPSATGGAG